MEVAEGRRKPSGSCVWPHAPDKRRLSPRSAASRVAKSAEQGEPTPMSLLSQGNLNHTISESAAQSSAAGGGSSTANATNATNATTGGVYCERAHIMFFWRWTAVQPSDIEGTDCHAP